MRLPCKQTPPNTSLTLHCSRLHHHLMIFAAGTSSILHSALLQLILINCTSTHPVDLVSLQHKGAFHPLTDYQRLHWWQLLENERPSTNCTSCRASLPICFLLRKEGSTTISCLYHLHLCTLARAKMNPSTRGRTRQTETASSHQSLLRRAVQARIETLLVPMTCQSPSKAH